MARQRLGREPVVRAGLKLLNERGLDGLTLGAIGKELNIRAPTLYWRFSSKQDLIDEMATQVVEDWARALPHPAAGTLWQEHARTFAHTLRQTLKTYREGARLVAGTYLRRPVLREAIEGSLEILVAAKFDISDAALCLSSLYHFVIGFTIEEQAVIPESGRQDPRYDLADREKRVDARTFPLVAAVGPYWFSDYDRRFGQGVDLILFGLSTSLSQDAAPSAEVC